MSSERQGENADDSSFEDKVKAVIEWNLERFFAEPFDSNLVEEIVPVAANMLKGAKSYYNLEQKATSAAVQFAEDDNWEDASRAAGVSRFLRERRVELILGLRELGVDAYNRPRSEQSVRDSLDLIKNTPHWIIPDFSKKEDDDESLWDMLRRYGEF